MKAWRSVALVGMLALVVCASSWSAPGRASAADTVVFGVPATTYGRAIANVLKVVIEDSFGIKVDLVPGSGPVIFKAMDQGKGDIDIHPSVWLPNSQSLVEEYVKRKETVILTDAGWKVRQGFCATRLAHDKYGVKSVYDLTRPEIVQLVNRKGAAKPEFWMGSPSWNSIPIDKARAKAYGLADLYELATWEAEVELARVTAALKRGEIAVFACDTAHNFYFPKGEAVFLDEPPYDPAKWKPVLPSQDPNWWEKTSVPCAWPPTSAHLAYSKRLRTTVPDVARLLDNVRLDADEIGGWTYAIAVGQREPADVAKQWVSANKGQVNAWLKR
jgi:glycine betaine/proline transport system substrate-binding protein